MSHRSRQQECLDCFFRVVRHELQNQISEYEKEALFDEPQTHLDDILEHGGHDASRTIRGRRDDAPSARVHFVHRDGVARQEVHGGYHRPALRTRVKQHSHFKEAEGLTGGMGRTGCSNEPMTRAAGWAFAGTSGFALAPSTCGADEDDEKDDNGLYSSPAGALMIPADNDPEPGPMAGIVGATRPG